MSHLSDEQLEELLSGTGRDDAHIRECDDCRRRLESKRAVRDRLRSAFESVNPAPALAERIRRSAAGAERAQPQTPPRKPPLYMRIWPALAAAAAVVLVAVPVVMFLTQTPKATAATAELAKIHNANVSGTGDFHRESDAQKLIAYLKSRVGHCPARPTLCRCASLTGCSVAEFRGQKIATYCMKTRGGDVSIILVSQRPDELGLSPAGKSGRLQTWFGRHGSANVVATRAGDLTYCAIGEAPPVALGELLTWAVPKTEGQADGPPEHICPFCRCGFECCR